MQIFKFCREKGVHNSKMAAVAILNCDNSTILEHIHTKCYTYTENKVPGQFLPSELVSDKFQDGGGRQFEIS